MVCLRGNKIPIKKTSSCTRCLSIRFDAIIGSLSSVWFVLLSSITETLCVFLDKTGKSKSIEREKRVTNHGLHLIESKDRNLPTSAQNRWGVVLAGGDGTRLQCLTRVIYGDDRPKQFCG